jgi:hypothetical protein
MITQGVEKAEGMKDEVLIFQHIPKTGGITLSHLLLQHFDRDQIFHVRNPEHTKAPVFGSTWGMMDEFIALPESRRSEFRCVMGHMPFGIHEHVPGKSGYLTVLRDPVERILSQHGQYNRMVQNQEIKADRLLSLEEYLDLKPSTLDNHQTRFLLGPAYQDRSDRDRFERVRKNLEKHFSLVGVLESFDETVLILNKLMGWSCVGFRRRNVGSLRSSRDEISPALLERMKEMNDLDFRLHAYAKEHLNRAIDSYGPGFDEDLADLRAANRKFSRPSLMDRIYSLGAGILRRNLGRSR